jgi:hypothetical protein
MQDVNQQPFIQEVLMKNTYKIMKKHNPNPSCKPSNDKSTTCQKIILQEVAPHSKETKNQDKS